MAKKGAIFFDLYGTLAEEVGYPNDPSRLRLFPWTIPTLKRVQENDYNIVVVTNQANVTRGYTTQEVLEAIFERFHALLALDYLSALLFYCSSIDEKHPRRKPNPGMAKDAAAALGISLTEGDNWMLGDSIKDMEFSVNAGFKNPPCFLLTGYGRGTFIHQREKLMERAPTAKVFTNAEAAVCSIMSQEECG